MPSREQIGRSTAAKLRAAAPALAKTKALIGFDGFVDSIIAVVDKRQSADAYTPVPTIARFAEKIAAASGQSSNYEMFVKMQKLGGNGPIMANALAAAGIAVTYIGNLGFPQPHPVFDDFRNRATVLTVAEPGYTDALEFSDGKLMMGKHQQLRDVTWESINREVGVAKFAKLFDEAGLVGMVNWTMLPFMSAIWRSMQAELLPSLDSRGKTLFVDLADPEKRLAEDLKTALNLLTQFQEKLDVTLGLNLKEADQVLDVLGLPAPRSSEDAIEETAVAIRKALGLSCVVVHPRKGAAAATASESATIAGPFIAEPKISTGAGDHFNAGFCLGRVAGLTLQESLCTGVGTSGFYVRTAISPTAAMLAEFVEDLPAASDA